MNDNNFKIDMKQQFDMEVKDLISMKKKRGFMMNRHMYELILVELKLAKKKTCTKTSEEYNLLKRYDISIVNGNERLVARSDNGNYTDSKQYIVTTEDLWDVLWDVHVKIGHGGRDRMLAATQKCYGNITTEIINVFIKYCKECQEKKKRKLPTCSTISSTDDLKYGFNEYFNYRLQFDLIEMSPCSRNNYKWILVVNNYLTKYFHLRPLRTNSPADVSLRLFDIFNDFGMPLILQNTHVDYLDTILNELKCMNSNMKILKSTKYDGVFETLIVNIKCLINKWLKDKHTDNWLGSLKHVQEFKMREYNQFTRISPYLSTFGKDIHEQVDIPIEIWPRLKNENDLFEYFQKQTNDVKCVNDEQKKVYTSNSSNCDTRNSQNENVNQGKRKRVSSVIEMILKNKELKV